MCHCVTLWHEKRSRWLHFFMQQIDSIRAKRSRRLRFSFADCCSIIGPMATDSVCPKCGGTGWIIVERANVSGAEPCDCRFEGRADRIAQRAQIPPLYQNASLENFVVPGPDNPIARRDLTNVLLQVKNYVREFPNESRPGLLLIGGPGTGKTHLAIAALRKIIERGFECL